MIISGVYRETGAAATAPKTAIVEIESRKYASSLGYTGIGILAGDIPVDSLCFVEEDNLDISLYIYNNYTENIDIQFEILPEELSNKSPANIFEFSSGDTALASAPTGAVYAQVRNNASGDEDGNNIKETYAKKNGTYPNMTVGNSTNATNADNATHATSADSATNATNATNATTAATANTLAESGKYTLLWSGSWDGESNLVVPGLSNYCAILVRWANRYFVCYKTTNFGLGISYGFTETLPSSGGGAVTITSLLLRTTATTSDGFSSATINTATIYRNNTTGPVISSSTVSTITEIRGIETLRVPT